ncbi:MAG: RNA-binding protein [Armatimonadota bacterium]|nr:RNA-binding protein [Armatimonadota bacterium]
MGKRLYVGNLSFKSTEVDLRDLFGQHGNVADARVMTDRETGRPRGFAFVEMSTEDEARVAIQALDGKEFQGRPLRVNEAQARESAGGGGARSRW